MAPLTAGFGPLDIHVPGPKQAVSGTPHSPALCATSGEIPGFPEEIPADDSDNPAAPGPEGPGVVFKRSCRWLANVTAVGVEKGRLRLNEQDR